jgi:hypothetical protein
MDSQCPTRFESLQGMDKKYCRVTLEPELEEIAALWPAAKRFEAARKLRRWARQLAVSAMVMVNDARPSPRRPGVPTLARRKAAWN